MMDALSTLSQAILNLLAVHQYSGLFFLLLLEEAGLPLPIPGDTLIVLVGARSRTGDANAAAAILLVAAAATLGSSALYWLARRGGRPARARYGRFLHLDEERVGRMEARFRHWGPWAIVLGRLIPGLRTPTSVMAGLFGVPYRLFAPCTALSALLWSLLYVSLGALFEPQWRAAVTLITRNLGASLGIASALAAVALGLALLLRQLRRAPGTATTRPGRAAEAAERRPRPPPRVLGGRAPAPDGAPSRLHRRRAARPLATWGLARWGALRVDGREQLDPVGGRVGDGQAADESGERVAIRRRQAARQRATGRCPGGRPGTTVGQPSRGRAAARRSSAP